MIPNQWYAILESKEVKKNHLVGVTRMGEKLVLWRDAQGQVASMSDLCPHRGVALSAGKLNHECVQCPFHGFEFDRDGRCTLIPANGRIASPPKAFRVRAYPAREAHGFIYIWWGEPQEIYPALPWFDNIQDDEYSTATIRDHWQTHYSRAIENQLDVVHLPFVHYNTIGRGNRTLVNGPVVRMDCKDGESPLLSFWVYNEVDQGQKPLRENEIPAPDRHPFIQFRFPNVWQNWISDDMRIVVAFAPIDEENTLLYLRLYQNIIKLPVLREIFNFFGALGNLYIERQDKRVVITQRPKITHLKMGEKLIQGDGPIVDYRRMRMQLQQQAVKENRTRTNAEYAE